ncbi:hypothetical protein JHL17_36150 [Azospirillum sp. YIM B02556]|uniref:Uncharacterized protein n=1 Tax=Azospirillum endophyticum TaxID=2800326 RepID=A0ABS1FHC3_9PROT|nr:hypothetical protein [Azospirillum endophyticum]MBK1842840.1 hypothetical protein [Azospirillum endophyticum]
MDRTKKAAGGASLADRRVVVTAGPQSGSPAFAKRDLAAARRAFEVKLWSTTEAVQAALASGLPARKPSKGAAAFLFAMTTGFVTGSVIDVDGGGLL